MAVRPIDANALHAEISKWPESVMYKDWVQSAIANAPTLALPTITGDTSDGYHTFNELYHHRAVLFSVICNARPDIAWKSKRHHDGTMYDGMFIVGIETPEGQATYHYDIEPYWSIFRVNELEYAPEWDGHTSDKAIRRIGTLTPPNEWVIVGERLPEKKQDVLMLFGAGNMAVGGLYDIDEHTTFWCVYTDDGFYTDCDSAPICWMPLPKPPKGSEDVAENATTAERCAWHEWIAGRFGDVR